MRWLQYEKMNTLLFAAALLFLSFYFSCFCCNFGQELFFLLFLAVFQSLPLDEGDRGE